MRNFLKEYFKLSNLEQKGTIALIVLICSIFLAPKIYGILKKTSVENSNEFEQWIASFKIEEKDTSTSNFVAQNYAVENIEKERTIKIELFNFNPNTISKEGLLKLGLSEYVSNNIVNFRNKGGKFYKKEDVKKIYGLKDEDFNRIEKYIQIETTEKSETIAKKEFENTKKTSYTPQPISLNLADSATFTTLKGIGPVYASRIIKYRNSLGGFIQKNQLLEVYGISDSLFQTIEPFLLLETVEIFKININTANLDELKKHPYIGYNNALAIIKYREQNGKFSSLDGINNIYSLSESTREKIKPYITTE